MRRQRGGKYLGKARMKIKGKGKRDLLKYVFAILSFQK
jgi:hypothetical protein